MNRPVLNYRDLINPVTEAMVALQSALARAQRLPGADVGQTACSKRAALLSALEAAETALSDLDQIYERDLA